MTTDPKNQQVMPIRVDDLIATKWDREADLLPPSKSELAQSHREHAQRLRQTSNDRTILVKVEPH